MKILRIHFLLLIAPLLSQAALAQSGEPATQEAAENSVPVQAARCQYTSDEGCADMVAQYPRGGMPRPRMRPPMRSRGGPGMRPFGYGAPFPEPSAKHVAIGFGIGFTLGAARPNGGTVGSRMAAGVIVGLLGAAVGAAVPSYQGMTRHHHRPWPGGDPRDDEDQVAAESESAKTTETGAAPATHLGKVPGEAPSAP